MVMRAVFAVPMMVGALAVLAAGTAHAADRAQAAITCKPAGVSLAYNCTVKLTNARTGAPLEKAQLFVGADMPSMPLAHNVPPATAKATGAPGEYHALVVLEMHGDWALRLKIGGPVRDQLIEVFNFSPQAVGPPVRKAVSPDPAPKAKAGHKH
jgi:hypothetical protein